MILPLVILYVVSLVYLSITERFRNFASIMMLQGWLLFVIALLRLHAIALLSLAALAVSISVTYCIADPTVDPVFFGVALYALLSGLVLIVLRSRLFSHMVGFLVIENGVFLFSTAIGVEMPFLINIAILLDILMSVLMLGVFFTKIDGKIHADDADSLTNVKD